MDAELPFVYPAECKWDSFRNEGTCGLCRPRPSFYYYKTETEFQDHVTACLTVREEQQHFDEALISCGLKDVSSSGSESALNDDELLDIDNILGADPALAQAMQLQGDSSSPAVPDEKVLPGRAFIAHKWQELYLNETERDIWERTQVPDEARYGFTVAVVGRAGAGKGSLINHLIDEPRAFVGDGAGNPDLGIYSMDADDGTITIKDIPGYDGPHAMEKPAAKPGSKSNGSRPWFWPFGGGRSKSDTAEDRKIMYGDCNTGALDVPNFLKHYNLLSGKLGDTDAVLYVIDKRSNPPAAEIINSLTRHGKLVALVFTNSESQLDIARLAAKYGDIPDVAAYAQSDRYQQACGRRIAATISGSMKTKGTHQIVDELSYMLWQVPTFFVVSRLLSDDANCSEYGALYEAMLGELMAANAAALDMPRLKAWLQRDLIRRLRVLQQVEKLVDEALKPFENLGWGTLLLSAGANLAASVTGGAVVAAGGPVATTLGIYAGSFLHMTFTTLYAMLEMCDAVGLVPTKDWRQRLSGSFKVVISQSGTALMNVATVEGKRALQAEIRNTLLATVGKLAISLLDDLAAVSLAAGALLTCVPVVGTLMYAATLRKTRRDIAYAVRRLAVAAHRRWIAENIPTPHTVRYSLQEGAEGGDGAGMGAAAPRAGVPPSTAATCGSFS